MKAVTKEKRRAAYPLVLIFAILALGIVAGGTVYYQHYERQFRAEAGHQLSAIADLKVEELVQYRRERLENAGIFLNNYGFSVLVKRFLTNPEDGDAQRQIQGWADKFMATDQYDHIRLLDVQGVTRLSSPVGLPQVTFVAQRIPQVLESDQVTFRDLHLNENDRRAYLNIMIPIFEEQNVSRPLGIFYLRIDPEKHLYPLIQRWPTPSRTAESLLLRREGNDALYLNDLRYRTNAALNLRISLEQTNVPAVRAALGQTGIMQGMDYRGVPVIAAVRAVNDSPWFLVAKVDTAEVYAPLHERLRLTILLVSLLLFGVGLGIVAFWRHQRLQFYKGHYQMAEALRESEERFGRVFEEGPTAMAMLDETFHFIQVNPAFASMLGYSEAEMQTMAFPDITHPDHVQKDVEQVRRLLRGELSVYRTEKRYVTKSGKELWGLVHVSVIRNAAGAFRYFLAIINDITERKQVENELHRTNTFLDSIIENLPNMLFLKDAGTLRFVRFNRAGVNLLGCSEDDLLGKTDYDFFPNKELADFYVEKDRQVLRGREVVDIPEEPLQTRDKGERILHTRKVPILNAAGEPEYLLGISEDITERKQAEAARRKSEEQLRSHTDNSPMAVIEWGADLIIARWTGAAEKMFGWSAAEAVGKPITELPGIYEEDLPAVQNVIRQLADGVSKQVFSSNRNRTWDGQVIHCEWYSSVLHDAGGKTISVLSQVLDVTERKRAEESLHYEQTLLATLMDNIPDAIYFKDAASRFIRVNRAHSRKLGLSDPAQIAGKSDVDFFSGEHAQQALADEQEIIRTGRPLLNVEEKETWIDGTVSWVLTTKLPLRDAAGRVVGTCGISLDITERKRAEVALQESRQMLRSVLDTIPVRVFWKDTEGRYLGCNRSFARDAGFDSPEALIGKNDYDMGWKDRADLYRADDLQVITSGVPKLHYEEPQTTPAGTQLWLRTNKIPLHDLAGRIIGVLGTYEDITERKRAEEAVRAGENRLRTLVQTIPDLVWLKDTNGVFLLCNSAFERLFGAGESSIVGKTDYDFVEKSLADFFRQRDQAAMAAGEPTTNEEWLTFARDGYRGLFQTIKAPVRDANGALVGVLGVARDITEIKRAEETARLNQERLLKVITQTRCILNSGQVEGPADWRERALHPESPFRWDFPVQNEEAAQKILPLELAPGERYQQAWTRSRNHADHTQMNWNSGNAFLNDLPFYRNEFRCIDKHGMGHWMQQLVTVRKLAENRWEVFGITTDISDLKRIEVELRESQALYHSLVDQMPAAVFRKDAEGRYVFANSKFCQLKNMTPDQFLGKTILEVGLKDVALATKGASDHATIMQSGNQIEDDEVYSGAAGETRYYRAVKSPVFDAARKIVGTQGILFDITERKLAEEALRWSDTQLQVILESTDDGILAVDHEGKKVIKANRRFAELWRIPQSIIDAGDNRAMRNFVLKQLSDPDAFLKRVRELDSSDVVATDTLVFKDGRVFERYSFPMMMDKAVIGRVWSFRDVTGRKRQERELTEKNSELERFTYTVSHDLKSPLVTVKTFLGYLEQDLAGPDKERVKQDVAYMHTAADKMSQLLDELLNLARVGRKMNPAERVTFKELAQEAIRLVAGRISTGGAEVQVADAAVVLEGDRPRLMEIWQNLVENACKFMGNQPKPRVEIGVEQRGSETVFFVRDNGAGIDPRYQEKVFGLFEKLDPKGEGTGMGLTLVKRIVEIYKGRIWVESPGLGQGANFLFTLPGAVIIDPEQSS